MAEPDLVTRIEGMMQAQPCRRQDLALLGGSCEAGRLDALLATWPNLGALPWRLWEYASAIQWARGELPGDTRLLERGRLFGDGGDLALRRDGERWLWSFVGEPLELPEAWRREWRPADYWDGHAGPLFRQAGRRLLLWGSRVPGQETWREDRVAGAAPAMRYPVEGTPERVQLVYDAYTEDGRVAFVRLRTLEGERCLP